MSSSNTHTAYILYRYDGEEECIMIDVQGATRAEMIEDGRRQAREILEPGRRFEIALDADEEQEDAQPA